MSSYVPLGAAEQKPVRIVSHEYSESEHPLLTRLLRNQEKVEPSLVAKAASLAAAVHAAVTRYIKPEPTAPAPPPSGRRKTR